MKDVLQNFYMMFRAIIEKGMKVNFEKGEVLLRKYEKKSKLFLNFPTPLMLPEIEYCTIDVEDEFEKDMKKLPQTDMELEYEFLNYIPMRIRDNVDEDGRLYYPRMRILVDRLSSFLISQNLIDKKECESEDEYITESGEMLIDYFFKLGRPKKIYVRYRETQMYLKDIASKARIDLVVKSKLKVIGGVYKELERMIY